VSTWRERFRPIIAATLAKARLDGADEKAALRAAYPCQRMGWAYKCWLDECARQRGTQAGRVRRAAASVVATEGAEQAGQLGLFGETGA
jgi:hypothetical protein